MDIIKKVNPKLLEVSKYELTLAEFPLFLLSKRDNNDIKVIEYEDTITGKDGKKISRKWEVYPDVQYGFGTASTQATFFELCQIWKENGFSSQYINFLSISNLLRRMEISKNKQTYEQIRRDLSCLIGIRINAYNAFWDKELKSYVSKSFHLFDNFELHASDSDGITDEPYSYIKASDDLYSSAQNHSFLTIDYDSKFFHNLSPIEQRLICYLSKIFKTQVVNRREIMEFAQQIPIYSKQPMHIKQQLTKSCKGLLSKGFKELDKFEFEQAKTNNSENIAFYRSGKAPKIVVQCQDTNSIKKKTEDEVELLKREILKVCGDEKSRFFYKKVAKLMPDEAIYRTLGEVKETKNTIGIRKSSGALFTSLIKKRAAEIGIKL